MIAYIVLFSALLSRLTALVCGSAWVTSFYSAFFEYPLKWCTYSAGMAGATLNCSRLSASHVYTIQPYTMSLHAKPHTSGVCVFSCNLHFWQNDRDLLRATVVTRGWNGYRNKSQHRKSTLEEKILPPFQQGFEPTTFQSWVRRSNHWAIPAPYICHLMTVGLKKNHLLFHARC